MNGDSGQTLIEVSPDGSLRRPPKDMYCVHIENTLTDFELVAAVEIKCPYPKSKSDSPYYDIPDYYISQCLTEMKALKVFKL